jgi:hypothetical protein
LWCKAVEFSTSAEAGAVVAGILDAQGPITVRFQTGIVKGVEKPHDPHYRLLEKAGYVKIGKDTRDYKTPVSLTPKGEAFLAELTGVKKSSARSVHLEVGDQQSGRHV